MRKNISPSVSLILSLLCCLIGTVKNISAETLLQNVTWQWIYLLENEPVSQSVVPESENYTLRFTEEGSLYIKVDCNMVMGKYAIDGHKISFTLGPSTLAACDKESMDMQFVELLSQVDGYAMEKNQLVLKLQNNKGKMIFSK